VQVTEDGQAVWTHLIEHLLQRVGEQGGDYYSHQYVIARAAHRYVPGSCVEPPADSERAKHVFVGTPRQGLCNMFGWSARVRGDTIRYRDVRLCRLHSKKRHACSLLHGWPPKFEIESASDNAATNRAIAKFLLCVALSELRSEGIIIGYAIRRGKIL
jgi:hypothetical protein